MRSFKKVVLPELNSGQLAMMLRAKYLIDVDSFSQVNGQPFQSQAIEDYMRNVLQEVK